MKNISCSVLLPRVGCRAGLYKTVEFGVGTKLVWRDLARAASSRSAAFRQEKCVHKYA